MTEAFAWGMIAALLLIALSFVARYVLGGSSSGSVVGYGTAQRNVLAAMVVASSNFTDPDVLVMIIVGALLMSSNTPDASAGNMGFRCVSELEISG